MSGSMILTLLAMTILLSLINISTAYPSTPLLSSSKDIRIRADPVFPEQPPSCPICAENYSGISSCARAAPVLANVSMIIFNPGAFIDVIKCACTDTFQSAYPQCVDCFEQTNQTDFLNASTGDLPSILSGINSICGIASTLFGGVATADGEVTPTSSLPVAGPTAVSVNGATRVHHLGAMSVLHIIAVMVTLECW